MGIDQTNNHFPIKRLRYAKCVEEKNNARIDESIVRRALYCRAFDQVLLENFSKYQLRGTTHTSLGQELLPSILSHLISKDDFVFGNHRSHALYLSMGGPSKSLYAEILGVEGGASNGIGGSQHLNHGRLYTNGIQGGMSPLSVGSAHQQIDLISICFLGDGTFGQGVLYESFNLAAVLGSPVLFVVEDNGIAQSTISRTVQVGAIKSKCEAFGIATLEVNGNDIGNMYNACRKMVEAVRSETVPMALIVEQNRLAAHSKGDDNRKKEIIEALWEKDYLNFQLSTSNDLQRYFNEIKVDLHNEFIALLRLKPARALFVDYSREATLSLPNSPMKQQGASIRALTYEALELALNHFPDLFIFGEDIEWISAGTQKPYGGAFGVTRDLSEKYPGKVQNSPISESGLVGFGIGRALSGKPTIIEIMFGDFTTLIVDQVRQQASKIVSMYGKRVHIPLVIRTPMGGRRGYGPTHSQNLEYMFLGIPNLLVYSQNIFFNPIYLTKLIENNLPTLFIEHKDLYNQIITTEVNNFHSVKQLKDGITLLENQIGDDRCLVLTYGYAASIAIQASQKAINENEVFSDVLCFSIISPLLLDDLRQTIEKYSTLILVEECDSRFGLIGSLLTEFERLGIKKIVKLCGGVGDIGSSHYSESAALISVDKVKGIIIRR